MALPFRACSIVENVGEKEKLHILLFLALVLFLLIIKEILKNYKDLSVKIVGV